jgi:hypothetical protein
MPSISASLAGETPALPVVIRLSRLRISDLGLGEHFIAEVGAEEARRVQVHLPAKDPAELLFHREETQAGDMACFELHQYIDIALRPEIVPQDGAEKGQTPDVMTPAELGELAAIDRDLRAHGVIVASARIGER